MEPVRTEEFGNADNVEQIQLGRSQVGKVDAHAALLVRAHELVQNLERTGVDLLDLQGSVWTSGLKLTSPM